MSLTNIRIHIYNQNICIQICILFKVRTYLKYSILRLKMVDIWAGVDALVDIPISLLKYAMEYLHFICLYISYLYRIESFLKWHITMTSFWARWRLKSPASRLFAQPFIQAHIKDNIKAVAGELPVQKASNAENVSIWWRHYDIKIT